MSLPKAVYDPAKKTRNLITTILGILGLLGSIAVGLGWITPEQSTESTSQLTIVVNAVAAIYGAILSLIAVFKATD